MCRWWCRFNGFAHYFSSENKSSNKPNITTCMADDLGWGDPGFDGILYGLFNKNAKSLRKAQVHKSRNIRNDPEFILGPFR